MREIKIFKFFYILFIFHLIFTSCKAVDIQIQVPQRGGMNFIGFDPLEEFLNFNNDLERIANAMMDLDSEDDNETIEISDNHDENTNKSNRVHREVKRTQGNGFETIEITEVHIGRVPNPGNILEMPLGGIMISKPRNLKGNSRNIGSPEDIALPIHIITQFDDFFDSLFGDIALKMMSGNLDMDLNEDEDHSHPETNEEKNHDDPNNHQNHIKITEIRDVTEDEKSKNKMKHSGNKEEENNSEMGKESEETTTIEDQFDTATPQETNNDTHEDQSLAIKFDSESENKSSDNVMTAKERKKQIIEERKKNLFAKICKYVFYSLVLLSFYILIKKLLQILGLIEPENNKKPYDNAEAQTDVMKNVELKTSNPKSE